MFDDPLTTRIWGPQPNLGVYAADTRRVALRAACCRSPDSHRYMYSIDHLSRAYSNFGIACVACRACAPDEEWVQHSRRPPSALERHAYALLMRVCGDEYWHAYEVHMGRHRSVDILLINKTNFRCLAVHVDGKQHAHTHAADAAFDAALQQGMHVLRLHADKRRHWLKLIIAAHTAICNHTP